jgi:hypothetical protein
MPDLEGMRDGGSFVRVVLGGVDGEAVDFTVGVVIEGTIALESLLNCLYLSARVIV